jgi:GTP-binding protein
MKGLSNRNRMIVANKIDVPESTENLELLKSDIDPNIPIISISAKDGVNIDRLILALQDNLSTDDCVH